jgi:hypothetical protein
MANASVRMSAALAKCKLEDVEFRAILQVLLRAAGRATPLTISQVDSFGVMRQGRHKSTGQTFSVRCLSKTAACTFSHIEHVQNERAFLSQVMPPAYHADARPLTATV